MSTMTTHEHSDGRSMQAGIQAVGGLSAVEREAGYNNYDTLMSLIHAPQETLDAARKKYEANMAELNKQGKFDQDIEDSVAAYNTYLTTKIAQCITLRAKGGGGRFNVEFEVGPGFMDNTQVEVNFKTSPMSSISYKPRDEQSLREFLQRRFS